jgi:plasmid stabilization system protein ParE
MGFNRIFAKEAQDEVNKILDNTESPELKQKFIKNFDNRLDILDTFPESGKNDYGDFRVVTFVKIPFKFVYKMVPDNILFVLAVFHQKQHPDTWKNRADKYSDSP